MQSRMPFIHTRSWRCSEGFPETGGGQEAARAAIRCGSCCQHRFEAIGEPVSRLVQLLLVKALCSKDFRAHGLGSPRWLR